jgi:hypothetical protein
MEKIENLTTRGSGSDSHKKREHYEAQFSKDKTTPTDIEEVWFAGCHCDVGGGAVKNETRHNLARIPLRWMIRECFKMKTGIMFESDKLRKFGLNPDHLYPIVLQRPPALSPDSGHVKNAPSWLGSFFARDESANPEASDEFVSEEHEELHDALSPKFDQLKQKAVWWLLELIPMKHRYQRSDNSWGHYIGWNRGQPRVIPNPLREDFVRVHRSVKIRMEAERDGGKPKYEPKAKVAGAFVWVD